MELALAVLAIPAVVLGLGLRYVKKAQNKPRLETVGVLDEVYVPLGRGEEPNFYVSYTVDGKAYRGCVGLFGAKGIDKDTPVGTKVTVLYDPNRPEDFYCQLG